MRTLISTTAITLYIILQSGFAQEINLPQERLNYLKLVNRAELSIVAQNIDEALHYYDLAFSQCNKHRAKDMYNKAICLKKKGDNINSDSLFIFLARNGFDVQRCFDDSNMEENQRQTMQEVTNPFEALYLKIFSQDQKHNKFRYTNMKEYANKVIENAKEIIQHAANSEDFMYYDMGGKLYLPILHYLQLKGIADRVRGDTAFRNQHKVYGCLTNIDFSRIMFEEFLYQQVEKGNLDNETLAEMVSNNNNWIGKPVSQYNEHIVVRHPKSICNNHLEQINKNREHLGLETYSEWFLKAHYTDSLLTHGNPFKPINEEEYIVLMMEFENQCNFNISGDYRIMLNFTSEEDAKRAYETSIKQLCIKD